MRCWAFGLQLPIGDWFVTMEVRRFSSQGHGAESSGRIPFERGHTPYRAPAKRRRSAEADEAGRRRGVEVGVSPEPAVRLQAGQRGGPTTEGSSRHPELSIRPDGVGPVDVPFLLGATRERMGGSVAASIGSHIVAGGLLILIISLTPEPVLRLVEPKPRELTASSGCRLKAPAVVVVEVAMSRWSYHGRSSCKVQMRPL